MKTLLEALRAIRDGQRDSAHGICHAIEHHAGVKALNENYALMTGWPEFSGDEAYPVPSYTPGHNPAKAYWAASSGDKWAGEYGAARLRLLDWCITELESRDANHPER